MSPIKFINSTTIKLNNIIYKGYTVSDLPNTFGFIYNEDKEKDGISEWIKHKGLTYIKQ